MEITMHERMYKKYRDSIQAGAVFVGTGLLNTPSPPSWNAARQPLVAYNPMAEMMTRGGIPLVKGDYRLEPRKEFYLDIEKEDLVARRAEYYTKFGVPVGEYSRNQYTDYSKILIKLLDKNISLDYSEISRKLSTVPAGKEGARTIVVGAPDKAALKVYRNRMTKVFARLNLMDYSLPEPFSDGEVLHSEWGELPMFKRKCLNCGNIMELTEHTPLSSTTKHLFTSDVAPYCPKCHSFKVHYIFNDPKVKAAQHTENMAWESGKLMVQNIDMHLQYVSKTPSIKVDSSGCVVPTKVTSKYEVIYEHKTLSWGFWDEAIGNPREWEVRTGCHVCDEMNYDNAWMEWHDSNLYQGNLPEAARALQMNSHTPIDMDNLPPHNPVCWVLKDLKKRINEYTFNYAETKRKASRVNKLIAAGIICKSCERVLTTGVSRKTGLCSNCREKDSNSLTFWIATMFPLPDKLFRALDMVDGLTLVRILPKWCPPSWDQQLQTYVGACYGQNEFEH